MKLQNLSIIFLVIAIPLILMLSYYLNLQQDTLELQAQYNAKLAEATKEGIKAFEVNTVDWSEWSNNQTNLTRRSNTMATINTFITSLSNNLNLTGTAKEYITNYIPAIAVTMYDGYYVYTPTYTLDTIETKEGQQLFYDEAQGILTTTSGANNENLPAYVPGDTATDIKKAISKYKNSKDEEITSTEVDFVTDINQAATEYKHMLSNQIPYSARYSKGATTNLAINYTLDNRIYVYGTIDDEYIEEDGYLVYFDGREELPRIKGKIDNPQNDDDIKVEKGINDTLYDNTQIQSEILEEQVLYYDGTEYKLETFKYVYDILNDKYYYDDSAKDFFTIDKETKEKDLVNSPKAGKEGCIYKSVSVLWGEEDTTEFKKIYQVISGPDQGKWYISIKEDPIDIQKAGREEIDTKLGEEQLKALGLTDSKEPEEICKVYSAISYYTEAYAFTNWVGENLNGVKQEIYNEEKEKYEATSIEIEGTVYDNLFIISKDNDLEKPDSPISLHKKQIMRDHVTTNLNLAISNYGLGTYEYKMPVLTDSDWEQVFSNISLITFFQGVPIGLKYYNNYAIATSNTNREYVDPEELYFTGEADTSYHRVYCSECDNIVYTGYRSVEYVLREYSEYDDVNDTFSVGPIYYYQHDKYDETNKDSETACYYCLVNKENITYTTEEDEKYQQTKSYNEALARERYYQREELEANLGVAVIYNSNMEVNPENGIEKVIDVNVAEPGEEPTNIQMVAPGVATKITSEKPQIITNNGWTWNFQGWADKNGKMLWTVAECESGVATGIFYDDVTILYAVWTLSLDSLEWNSDFKWAKGDSNYAPYRDCVGCVSVIRINKDNVEMYGNGQHPGKRCSMAKMGISKY